MEINCGVYVYVQKELPKIFQKESTTTFTLPAEIYEDSNCISSPAFSVCQSFWL